MKRFVSLLLVIAIVVSLCSCSFTDVSVAAMKKMYESDGDKEALAYILIESCDKRTVEDIRKYAPNFLFCAEDEIDDMYNALTVVADKAYGIQNGDDESVATVYDAVIWTYLISLLCDENGGAVSDNTDFLSAYEKCHPLFKTDFTSRYYLLQTLIEDSAYPQAVISAMLIAMNGILINSEPSETADLLTFLRWAYDDLGNKEASTFYLLSFARVNGGPLYSEEAAASVYMSLEDDGGTIEAMELNALQKKIEGLGFTALQGTTEEVGVPCEFSKLKEAFGASPECKTMNGIFTYTSGNYLIAVFGTEVATVQISDKNTGDIVLMYYKTGDGSKPLK